MENEGGPQLIGVIGAGIMGEALISALIASGRQPATITISEKREERAAELIEKYGVRAASLRANVQSSDAILLVVKPQDMATTLDEMKESIRSSTLVISFAAGKRIEFVNSRLGSAIPVIRVMPNTPTLVGEGMAAISIGTGVSASQVGFVKDFLSATGQVVVVAEELQDAVTAVSGSGPAYFFAFVEAMVEAGKELGLPEDIATQLSVQTLVGAAKLLDTSGKTAKTLRENVTSPNGTTAAALASFTKSDLAGIVDKAMTAARDRSQELA
ncbi:MAG: pyrroline-5-carboxylate reductase [Actinobacteria bacterium]|nr:pyrroline-5-carboxylate reductase [Actinomycetota bacterium]